MEEPRWLNVTMILAIHSDQIQQHGGSLGLRDRGLLDSALARRRNRYHYESAADLVDLAAASGFAIARNHPFVDGNKRVAFQAMYVSLLSMACASTPKSRRWSARFSRVILHNVQR